MRTNKYFKLQPPNDWFSNLEAHRIKQKPGKHPHYGPWYSDDGEDGVLSYLFHYINIENKFAVDIGLVEVT